MSATGSPLRRLKMKVRVTTPSRVRTVLNRRIRKNDAFIECQAGNASGTPAPSRGAGRGQSPEGQVARPEVQEETGMGFPVDIRGRCRNVNVLVHRQHRQI